MTDYTELIKQLERSLHLGDAPIGRGWGTLIDKQTLKDAIDTIKTLTTERNQLQNDIWELNDLLEFKDDMIGHLKTQCKTCPHDAIWEKRGFIDYE